MAEAKISRTQARSADRARRRAEKERQERIKFLIPFGILGVLAVLAIGFVAYSTLQSSGALEPAGAKPKFTVDTEKLELGDQKLGHPIKASFNIKNTGDGRLTLSTPPMVTALEGC